MIIASFAWLDEKEAATAKPKLVFVDAKNHIAEVKA